MSLLTQRLFCFFPNESDTNIWVVHAIETEFLYSISPLLEKKEKKVKASPDRIKYYY
jgi:hypothetical protein